MYQQTEAILSGSLKKKKKSKYQNQARFKPFTLNLQGKKSIQFEHCYCTTKIWAFFTL